MNEGPAFHPRTPNWTRLLHPHAEAFARLLLVRPDACVDLQELEELSPSARRSLERGARILLAANAVEWRDGTVLARPAAPFWAERREVEAKRGDPVPLLRHACTGITGLEAVFVFGSVADGTDRPDSDIDLFVLGNPSPDREYIRRTTEITLILGRPIRTVRYSKTMLLERTQSPDHPAHAFVARVLAGPKIWIVGYERALRGLAPPTIP